MEHNSNQSYKTKHTFMPDCQPKFNPLWISAETLAKATLGKRGACHVTYKAS